MGRVGPRAAAGLRPRAFPRIIQVRGNALFLAFPAKSGIVERHRDAFELLCRDLIGRRLGATPEGFRPGRGTASTSGTRGTRRAAEGEVPKLERLRSPAGSAGRGA